MRQLYIVLLHSRVEWVSVLAIYCSLDNAAAVGGSIRNNKKKSLQTVI